MGLSLPLLVESIVVVNVVFGCLFVKPDHWHTPMRGIRNTNYLPLKQKKYAVVAYLLVFERHRGRARAQLVIVVRIDEFDISDQKFVFITKRSYYRLDLGDASFIS